MSGATAGSYPSFRIHGVWPGDQAGCPDAGAEEWQDGGSSLRGLVFEIWWSKTSMKLGKMYQQPQPLAKCTDENDGKCFNIQLIYGWELSLAAPQMKLMSQQMEGNWVRK